VQKLKEPSVSALVQKIERLKTAIETGKPFDDAPAADAVSAAHRVEIRPEARPVATASQVVANPVTADESSPHDTGAVLQKAFLAEEVPVNPDTQKLFGA
jgi:hypothetical protein